MQPIRLLLANHQPIVRNSLRFLLERDSTVQVVGEAANGWEAVVLADYQRPEIVLLDVQLPHVSGIAAAREIFSREAFAKIIFVSGLTDESYVQEAFKAGARGYVLEDVAQTDLPIAIATVARGGVFLSPLISVSLIDRHKQPGSYGEPSLSDRDRQLFCWLAAGQDEQSIAQSLNLNVNNVRAECEDLWNRLHHLGLPSPILASMQAHSAVANT